MSVVIMIQAEGEIYSLALSEKAKILGRSSSCDLKLDDVKISSKHLAIKTNGNGEVLCKDLNSTNGTFINGFKINETKLGLNDILFIGDTKIWIDEEHLSLKERRILDGDKDNKTELKFIDLQGEKTSIHENRQNLKKIKAEVTKSVKEPPPPKVDKPADPTKSYEHTSHTVQVDEDGMMEQEASTGMTKMIKIDRSQTSTKSPKGKAKRRKRNEEEEESGLFGKIKGLFKK